MLCNPEMLEPMLGDLDEKYEVLSARFGESFANKWYWSQAWRSVVQVLARWAERIAKLDALRRLIS